MRVAIPEIVPSGTVRRNLRIVRGEPFRFQVLLVETDPTVAQPEDEAEPRLTRPYDLSGHQAVLELTGTPVQAPPATLLSLTRGGGLIVDDDTGAILVDLTDEDTSVMGLRTDGSLEWDHGVYRLRVEKPAEGDAMVLLRGEFWVDP